MGMYSREQWIERIGHPETYDFEHKLTLTGTFATEDFDAEYYLQANGPGTSQRVLMLFPKGMTGKVPGVVVPFYFPEAMLGYNPWDDKDDLSAYQGIEMMLHLVRRGYAVVSADSYHLTCFSDSEKARGDYYRWKDAGEKLKKDHPNWSGIGKLTADTRLLIDIFAADSRVDEERLGIAGHSLGGKMAFYTGCLDKRIKVILASDFGMGWDQTNWSDIWYWGEQVEELKTAGMDHTSLLNSAAPKPFFLLAGKYDNEDSFKMMNAAPAYEKCRERLGICNHATGHRPPAWALEQGYAFLDKWLKRKPVIGMTPLVDRGAGMTMMLNTYTESILGAGGIPLILPLTEEEKALKQMLDICDGFVFTGGHDVDPQLYGEEKMDCTGPCRERDEFERKLLPLVLESGKPVLAICRGMQLLNVVLGGNLYQDIPTQLPSEIQHRMGPASDKVIHEVDIVEGTPLMDIAGQKRISVNSYHHQCVRRLGSGLEVMAYAPDGIIEGVYMPGKKFVVAVQWHPERIFHNHEEERKLFETFIGASCS